MQISFVMLIFLLFSDQFFGSVAKVAEGGGGELLEGGSLYCGGKPESSMIQQLYNLHVLHPSVCR